MNRVREDIDEKLGHAKLDISSLSGPAQVLGFADPLFSEDVRLVEMEEILIDALETGDEFVFRGKPDDLATMCSTDQTWDVKEAETSNTMLLFRSTLDPADPGCSARIDQQNVLEQKIVGFYTSYLELRKKRIDKTRAMAMLSECKYCGPNREKDDRMLSGNKYTFDDLMTCVQSSPVELRQLLPKLRVCTIDGFQRMLDFDYLVQVMMEIVDLIQSRSWDLDLLDSTVISETLSSVQPRAVVEAVLSWYSDPVGEAEGSQCSLNKANLCRLYAEMLLCGVKAMNLEDFIETWQDTMPFELQVSLEFLKGLVVIVEGEQNSVIQMVRILSLPDDPSKRLQVLFQIKPKWTLDEIQPFLCELVSGKETVAGLLMKHSRSSMVGKQRLYCSKG